MLLKTARKIVVAVIGVTVILIGVIMVVTPGPALVVIPAGVAILGTEFAFARRWLRKVRERAASLVNDISPKTARAIRGRPADDANDPEPSGKTAE